MILEQIVFLRALVAFIVAALGALIAVSFKKVSHYSLCAMISVAAGALLSVTIFEILPEAYDVLDSRIPELVISFISGYALFYLVSKYVYHICPACAATHAEERFISVNYLMIAAISLHSTMDGIGVAISYATGNNVASIAILFAVSFHKFPEGLALASVARAAGYTRSKATLVAFAVECTTLLGAGLVLMFISSISNVFWYGLIMAHIGGGFVYLTAHAMLGEMVKHEKKSILVYAAIGFMAIVIVSLLLSAIGIGA